MADAVERLRREARSAEQAVEQRLSAYARLEAAGGGFAAGAALSAAGDAAGVRADDVAAERARDVADALQKFVDLSDQFARAIAERPTPANAAMAQRFHEVAFEFRNTFQRLQALHRQRRDTDALFRELHGGAGGKAAADRTAMDHLLRERNSLVASTRATDETLEVASETHAALRRQRAGLLAGAAGVASMAARLPGVGTLMTAIGDRRVRNDRIVAVALGLAACFLLWYFVLRRPSA